MCIRFVYCGNDVVTGFNFDIDLSEWDHRVIEDKERFYIGIRRPDGIYHSYHGVNRNGNVGTLLYVHGNGAGAYEHGRNAVTVAELTEWFIQGQVSLDDILGIAKEKKITYAPDATMQAMLSDIHGRVLIIEPGVGVQKERNRYALMSNYSLLNPSSTKMYVLPSSGWIHVRTYRFQRPFVCLMLFGWKENGEPEYLLFIRLQNRQFIISVPKR